MMNDALYVKLNALRDEYRAGMNKAADEAQRYAQEEDMEKVSLFSTESERKREAFHALNRAISILDSEAKS